MGIWATISKVIRPPPMKTVLDTPHQIKETLQRTKINNIDVILLDNDMTAGDVVSGMEDNLGAVPIIHIKTPSPMGFFNTNSFFNRTTGKKTIIARKKDPYTLELNRDIIGQQYNDFAAGNIKDGYKLPILINNLPYDVIKVNEKYGFRSPEGIIVKCKIDNPELNPSLLSILGLTRLAKDVNEEDTSMVAACALVFVPLGMALLAILQAFATGN